MASGLLNLLDHPLENREEPLQTLRSLERLQLDARAASETVLVDGNPLDVVQAPAKVFCTRSVVERRVVLEELEKNLSPPLCSGRGGDPP